MDDGGWANGGVRISSHSFSFKEVTFLISILKTKFLLDCNIQNVKIGNTIKHVIYIRKNSIDLLKEIILPHLHKSMYYKLDIKESSLNN
jgi:hypothetical protein